MSQKKKRMHDVQAMDSTGGRFDAYRRELERLACECEDMLGLLEDGKPDGVRWATEKIAEALDRVHALGAPEHRRRSRPAVGDHVRVSNGGGRAQVKRGPCFVVRYEGTSAEGVEDASALRPLEEKG